MLYANAIYQVHEIHWTETIGKLKKNTKIQ